MQDPAMISKQSLSFENFNYDSLQIYNQDCGPVKQKLIHIDSDDPVESWISLSDNSIDINFLANEEPCRLKLALFTWLEEFPNRNIITPFTVTKASAAISCIPSTPLVYNYGSPALNFGISVKNETYSMGMEITSTTTPIGLDTSNNIIPLPSFIKYTPATKLFSVKDIKPTDFGIYTVGVNIAITEYPTFQV